MNLLLILLKALVLIEILQLLVVLEYLLRKVYYVGLVGSFDAASCRITQVRSLEVQVSLLVALVVC